MLIGSKPIGCESNDLRERRPRRSGNEAELAFTNGRRHNGSRAETRDQWTGANDSELVFRSAMPPG